jgi:hypothetical protein
MEQLVCDLVPAVEDRVVNRRRIQDLTVCLQIKTGNTDQSL